MIYKHILLILRFLKSSSYVYNIIRLLMDISALDWINPVGFQQLPLKAEAIGIKIFNETSQVLFHHIYNYYEFRVDLTVDDTIFQVNDTNFYRKERMMKVTNLRVNVLCLLVPQLHKSNMHLERITMLIHIKCKSNT